MAKKLENSRKPTDVQKFLDDPKKYAKLLKQALRDINFGLTYDDIKVIEYLVKTADRYEMYKELNSKGDKVKLRIIETALKAKLVGFNGTPDELKKLIIEFCEEKNIKVYPDEDDPTEFGLSPSNPIFVYEYQGDIFVASFALEDNEVIFFVNHNWDTPKQWCFWK